MKGKANEKHFSSKEEAKMTKVLVLYYSMYGHIETMANKVAEGARSVDGVEVTVKRVPETMDNEAFKAAGGKVDQDASMATPAELGDYDAIIVGTPTRARQPASAIWPDKCAPSSIRPAAFGPRGAWQVKWRAYSPQPGQRAVRK